MLEFFSQLTQLNELHVKLDIDTYVLKPEINPPKVMQLTSIKRLRVIQYFCNSQKKLPFDAQAWCEKISFTYPNLEEFTLVSTQETYVNAIKANADIFGSIKCRFLKSNN